MSSGSKLADLEFDPDDEVFIAQADLANYFYHLGIPSELSEFFALPGLDVALLREGCSLPPEIAAMPDGTCVSSCLAVVPMGWSWAMWVAQRVVYHQSLCSGAAPADRILCDDRPAPDMSGGKPALLPCADNLNVVGSDAARSGAVRDELVSHFRSIGFVVHEIHGPRLTRSRWATG